MSSPRPTPNPRPADDASLLQEQRGPVQRRLVWLICAVTPKCPEVARLLSREMEEPLSLLTRLRLRLHFLMCGFCERYGRQLHFLRRAVRALPEKAEELPGSGLASDAKERLKRRLRQEAGRAGES